MAQLEIDGVWKRFGTYEVIRDLTLSIADGEFVVFVGPSGCGKSTALRLICGLEHASAGDVRIDGVSVRHLPPSRRGLAMVFQSYALYPHMTVAQNMGFSLRMEGVPKTERMAKVREAAALLRLDALLDRKPRDLSGGQRQRVAIGRAILRKPKVFLFDEPLSNLDAELRVQMRFELARRHRVRRSSYTCRADMGQQDPSTCRPRASSRQIVLAGRSRMAPITRWLLPRLCSAKITPRSSLLRCLLRLSIATSYDLRAGGVALET
jgi:ABC-type sugar transport system ATPase subunit